MGPHRRQRSWASSHHHLPFAHSPDLPGAHANCSEVSCCRAHAASHGGSGGPATTASPCRKAEGVKTETGAPAGAGETESKANARLHDGKGHPAGSQEGGSQAGRIKSPI